MKNKIFYSIVWIVLLIVIISDVLFTVLMYERFLEQMKKEVKNNMTYVSEAVERGEMDYLASLPRGDDNSRITYIKEDGTVLYDSIEDIEGMKNHKDRKEIKQALDSGTGESFRYSGSIEKQTYYYAKMLSNGNIIRLSSTITSIIQAIGDTLPYLVLFVALVIGLSLVVADVQARKLIAPINQLNLDDPLKNDVYEELSPLLLRLETEIKQAENRRKEFVANASHELKTPLMSISGYAEIIQNGMVKPEDIPVFSGRIYQEAKRLSNLVEDIIRLSQFDDSQITCEMEPVNMKALTHKVLDYLTPSAVQRQITISVEGDDLVINGVPNILEEMVYNLCDNAVKYNKDGGSVHILLVDTEKERSFTVSDTGIGIPEDSKHRVFERFYRVDKSHSRESGGTGLGLSIVKHAALFHHGSISLTSQLGEGTSITVRF